MKEPCRLFILLKIHAFVRTFELAFTTIFFRVSLAMTSNIFLGEDFAWS